MTHTTRSQQRGNSLLEVVMAIALSALVALGLGETVSIAASAQRQLDAVDRGTRAQQAALAKIRDLAFSAIRVLGNDDVGQSLFAALDKGDLVPLEGTRLPVLDPTGSLDGDLDGAPRTGNALLVVSEDRPVELTVDGEQYRFDVVRIVAFYLIETDERVMNDERGRIDLVRFTSAPYVLRSSIDQIESNANYLTLIAELRALGLDRIMKLDEPATTAFQIIDNLDEVVADTSDPPVIPPALDFPRHRLLVTKRLSVARNGTRTRVPRFALPDAAAPKFPAGFEVKTVGPWSATRVLVRMVLVSGNAGSHDVTSDVTKVVTVGAR